MELINLYFEYNRNLYSYSIDKWPNNEIYASEDSYSNTVVNALYLCDSAPRLNDKTRYNQYLLYLHLISYHIDFSYFKYFKYLVLLIGLNYTEDPIEFPKYLTYLGFYSRGSVRYKYCISGLYLTCGDGMSHGYYNLVGEYGCICAICEIPHNRCRIKTH